jgi:FkbM family methyltransferase
MTKLLRLLHAGSYRSAILRHRVAASVEHERALRLLACRTVVDVGANRGQFSLLARRCFPEAKILAFEPLPGPAECFGRVHGPDTRVTLYQAALGARSEQATIHVGRRDDASSLLAIGALQRTLFPHTDEVDTKMVQVGRLTDFLLADHIQPPALLKLDVQGYELEALKGCEDLLERFEYVCAECSFLELYEGQALADEVVVWLAERGYGMSGVHNLVSDRQGRTVQADFLFKKRDDAFSRD